jgi:MFS family permease
MVAQGWLVYDLTDSPLYLGLVGVARAFAMICLPPFGGVLADRVARLRLLKTTRWISLGFALALATLVATGLIEIWQIFLLSFLSGCVEAFDQPARTALLPNLVRREDLSRAIALNSSTWQGSALFGPTLAGIMIATVGLEATFFANAVGYLAVLAALYLMRGVPERSGEREPKGITQDFAVGLRYVTGSRFVLILLALALVTSVFGRSYQQLLPVFARDVLDSGSTGLGLMMSAPGAGTMAGAVLLQVLGDFRYKGRAQFTGTARWWLLSGSCSSQAARRFYSARCLRPCCSWKCRTKCAAG